MLILPDTVRPKDFLYRPALPSRRGLAMAISIVNGYFCASCCDVAKAKKGESPHPSTDPGNIDDKDRKALRTDDPAVLFGGALSASLSADAVKSVDGTQPADPASARRTGQAVDVLA
jgi:hypothetical protein